MWLYPPWSISVRSRGGNEANHIEIAWYLHGMLIGKPDYQADRRPFYIEQWVPGIYFYHAEK